MFDPADIYLDFAAACPKRPEVAALHERRCARFVANPHGTGRFGTDARRAIEKAEAEVLDLLAIPRDEATAIWTSGGTEAANLAIFGTAGKTGKASIAVSATAHTCLLEPADATVGAKNVRRLPVDTSIRTDQPAQSRRNGMRKGYITGALPCQQRDRRGPRPRPSTGLDTRARPAGTIAGRRTAKCRQIAHSLTRGID